MLTFCNNEIAIEYLLSCGYAITGETKSTTHLENTCGSKVKISNGRVEFINNKEVEDEH